MESHKIALPEPPKIEQKETAEDKRTFAVVPIAALRDKRLRPSAKAILAMICSYCNRAGVTHVSQNRIASDMQTSQSQVSKSMAILQQCGYIEIIGKHYPMSKGRTVRVIFKPDVTMQDAVTVASREGEDLRPGYMLIDDDEQLRDLMEKDNWTEEELRANKERLARLLIKAFKTSSDKPKMYSPVKGDTLAVKKVKQEIRSRMRELRKEEYEKEYTEENHIQDRDTNTKRISLYVQSEYRNIQSDDVFNTDIEPAIKMGYEELVLYFESELFNGVKTESDLHICSLLAERGITRSELERYVTAHSGETVTQIGKRILA